MVLCPYDGTPLLSTLISPDAPADTIKPEASVDETPIPSSLDPNLPLVKVDNLHRTLMRISSRKRGERKQLPVFPSNVSSARQLNALCLLFESVFSPVSS